MLGKADNGLLNRFGNEERTYGEWIEAGEQIASLFEHPGWVLVQEYVEDARAAGVERLLSNKSVLTEAQYAQRLAQLDGITYAADVAASIAKQAETCRAELERTAALERAATKGE